METAQNLNPTTELFKRDEFRKFLQPDKNYFVFFTATWCKYCHIAKPKVEQYLNLLRGRNVKFEYLVLDADQSGDIARFLKVKAYPTLLCIMENTIQDACVGGGEQDLKEFFNESYRKIQSK